MSEQETCICFRPPFHYTDFAETHVGIDLQNGRNGEVSLQQCRTCQRVWLHYHFEWEWFSNSGRWYRGLLTPEVVPQVTAESAVAILESLPWYFCGGSYFNGQISRIPGPGKLLAI